MNVLDQLCFIFALSKVVTAPFSLARQTCHTPRAICRLLLLSGLRSSAFPSFSTRLGMSRVFRSHGHTNIPRPEAEGSDPRTFYRVDPLAVLGILFWDFSSCQSRKTMDMASGSKSWYASGSLRRRPANCSSYIRASRLQRWPTVVPGRRVHSNVKTGVVFAHEANTDCGT